MATRPVAPQTPPPPPIEWQTGWSEKTLEAAYKALRDHYTVIQEAVNAVDTKAVTLFGISSAILSLVPSLHKLTMGSPGWWLGLGAVIAWMLAVYNGWRAYRPREYRAYPDPDWTAGQLSLPEQEFQARLLESVRKSIQHDKRLLADKGAALKAGLIFAALEVALLVSALLAP